MDMLRVRCKIAILPRKTDFPIIIAGACQIVSKVWRLKHVTPSMQIVTHSVNVPLDRFYVLKR